MSHDSAIQKLLHRIESAHLEHKSREASLESIVQTACAFLNSGGGTLLVEAGHDRKKAKAKAVEIEQAVRAAIKPPAFWTVGVEEIDEEHFCIVDVPAGRDRPYAAGGRIYLREGAATVAAAGESVQSLVESSYREVERWERQLQPSADLKRLDHKLILDTAEIGRSKRDFPFTDAKRVEAILGDLALYRQGAFTNAAEVLFGVRPAIQFPQIRARVAVYAAHKGSDFIDSRAFEGPMFQMLEEILVMVKKHTPVASLFRGGLRRTDQPVYPEEAVREGLVNAFAHRDYADFGGGVSVDIYPERLVIWNAGALPPSITIGDLKRAHPSMPRNPDISQVFWLRGYMDRVGRGIENIINWCREAGLPDPQWKINSGVSLTFKHGAKTEISQLNSRQKQLLRDLATGQTIRLPDYSEKYLVSERQARRDLTELAKSGFLNRQGEGPATVFVRLEKAVEPAKPGQTRPE